MAASLLILGGTSFLGPHLVEAALAHEYAVTLFNRGRSSPENGEPSDPDVRITPASEDEGRSRVSTFKDVETILGDRTGDLRGLAGRSWDAVIDTSGYVPRVVAASARALAGSVGRYVFISTISVYQETAEAGIDETAPTVTLADPSIEEVSNETYGALKASCERAAEHEIPGRVTVIRPGLIAGPGDKTDRFTYWPVRVARGGDLLAPGTPGDPVQFIDVRDLAAWTIHTIEGGKTGIYNATGPAERLGIGALLESCRRVTGAGARFTWVDAGFLDGMKVAPWSDMPVWIPPAAASSGLSQVSCARAIAEGLTFRPLEDTVRDTLAWWKALPEERRLSPKAGITAEREAEVLAAWRGRSENR